MHGDLGNSTSMSMPVTAILKKYGAATFELAFLAVILAMVIGIPLGKFSAHYRDIFTREFWLGGPHVDSYGEPNQLGRISQYGGGRMQPLWFAVFIVLGIGVQG